MPVFNVFVSLWVNPLQGLVLSKQSRLASCTLIQHCWTIPKKNHFESYFGFVFPVLVSRSPCRNHLDWHYVCLSRVCLSIPFFFVKTISTGVMFVFPVFVSQSLSFLSKQSRLVSYFYKTSLFARRNMLWGWKDSFHHFFSFAAPPTAYARRRRLFHSYFLFHFSFFFSYPPVATAILSFV